MVINSNFCLFTCHLKVLPQAAGKTTLQAHCVPYITPVFHPSLFLSWVIALTLSQSCLQRADPLWNASGWILIMLSLN